MKKIYKVYMITSPNGKKYIGMTRTSMEKRWNNGNGYIQNKPLFDDIKKYGKEKFTRTVLYDGLTKEEAENQEKRLISVWETQNPEKGYNVESGGLHPEKLAESTKKKMSISHIGLPRDEKYRKNISEAKKGKKNGMYGKTGKLNPTSRAVIAMKDGVLVGMFDSMKEANENLGLPNGAFKNISACCHGKRRIAYGYTWSFAK